MPEIGITKEITKRVTPEMTAAAVGSGELAVLATPVLIAAAEECAWKSVAGELDEGFGTVGTRMDLSHIAATPEGGTFRCQTTLKEVDRRRLVFAVEAFDETEKIAEGTHERFIVENRRFEEKARAKKNEK